jgi:alpha-beta hydrolase superfamily lysophospholipase
VSSEASSLRRANTPPGQTKRGQKDAAMVELTDRFRLSDGTVLHVRQWTPDTEPTGVMVLIHGYSEHGARYRWLASRLTASGMAVSAPDLRGHGESPGKRAHIASFPKLVDDIGEYVSHVRGQSASLPLFVMGHSMGGLLAASYAAFHKPRLSGVVLSSSLLTLDQPMSPLLRRLACVARVFFPGVPVSSIETGATSRDPEAVRECASDPLQYHGRLRLYTGVELLLAVERMRNHFGDMAVPLLLLHGTSDRICNVDGSRDAFRAASSADKTLRLFEGGYHELFNDFGKEVYASTVTDWVCSRLTQPTGA